MGVKSTIRAAGALAKVHAKALPDEFRVAKTMAAQDEKLSNIDRAVEVAEAKVIKTADKCERKSEELAEAETELSQAKEELTQLRAVQEAKNTQAPNTEQAFEPVQ